MQWSLRGRKRESMVKSHSSQHKSRHATPTRHPSRKADRSPTTDVIAFSPKMWPVEQHPITKEHRKRLAVLQNGCELTNDDYSACYDSAAFDYKTAKSNTKKFELQRQSPNDYQACAMEKKQGQFYANAATFPTDNPPPDSCKWSVTYSSMRFMHPVPLTDSQLVADVAANLASGGNSCSKHSDGTTWMYDYAFEICHHPGLCTENSWDCVAAYTIVALGDPFKGDSRNLFRYEAEVKDGDGKVCFEEGGRRDRWLTVEAQGRRLGPCWRQFSRVAYSWWFRQRLEGDHLQGAAGARVVTAEGRRVVVPQKWS